MGFVEWHSDGRSSKIMQDRAKKSVMHVQMNGFPGRWVAFPLQGERNAVLVEVGIETRRALKGPNVKLIRIFDRHFGFIWNGIIHSGPSSDSSRSETPIHFSNLEPFDISADIISVKANLLTTRVRSHDGSVRSAEPSELGAIRNRCKDIVTLIVGKNAKKRQARTYLIEREMGIAACLLTFDQSLSIAIATAASPLFFRQLRLALADGNLFLHFDSLCSFRNNDAEHAFVELCPDLRIIGTIG
jgi:hypothetical protein